MSATRAESVRRFRANPAPVLARKAAIRAGLLADHAGKAIAADVGVCTSIVSRWARSLGFRMMYVTDTERAAIMARRMYANSRGNT